MKFKMLNISNSGPGVSKNGYFSKIFEKTKFQNCIVENTRKIEISLDGALEKKLKF